MQFDISVDTEALVVDAYPQMKSAEHMGGVAIDDMDIAWGFYMAMHTRHPELMQEYATRMRGMITAVRDIEKSSRFSGHNTWFTTEEMDEDRAIQLNAAMRALNKGK